MRRLRKRENWSKQLVDNGRYIVRISRAKACCIKNLGVEQTVSAAFYRDGKLIEVKPADDCLSMISC